MSDTQINDNDVGHRIQEYVHLLLQNPRALRGQQLRGGGATAEFENLLAESCGFPYCVATSNATTALMALALILRVQKRTVFFPKNHWEGSVSAFRLFGAKIKRYDSHRTSLHRAIFQERPIAIVVGNDLPEIDRGQSILVIEDSCRIPGVTNPNKDCSAADIQILSFGPGKPLALGEGGAALFRKRSLYKKFVRVSQHPERMAAEFSLSLPIPRLALNGRIHQITALVGSALLRRRRLKYWLSPTNASVQT